MLLETLIGLGSLISGSSITSYIIQHPLNIPEIELQTNVSIQVPTLNEEEYIEETLISLRNQNVLKNNPNMVELIVIDSNSEDKTTQIAEKYADKILNAPRGKLTARRIGIENTDAEIICSCDADCLYKENYLNFLLSPFKDNNTVAVSGVALPHPNFKTPQIFPLPFILRPLGSIFYYPFRLDGKCSAFKKSAFQKIGGWNENINQLDIQEMLREEEINFCKKLMDIGRVPTNPFAIAYTRRFRESCDEENQSQYCKEITKIRFGEEKE